MKLNNFKDKCDICKQFKILKSYNDKCMCDKCMRKYTIEPIRKKLKIRQINLFERE